MNKGYFCFEIKLVSNIKRKLSLYPWFAMPKVTRTRWAEIHPSPTILNISEDLRIGEGMRENNAYHFLAPVVQTLDSAIRRINHYPADKYYGNQLRYLLDSDLSAG